MKTRILLLLGFYLLFVLMFPACSRKGLNNEDPYSPPSPPPDSPYQIRDLTASIMQYDNKIRLLWFVEPEAPGDIYFHVYRSESRTGKNEFIDIVYNNEYEDAVSPDSIIKSDTPYFYSVTWGKDGKEYGKPDQRVLGLFSSVIDVFEPNDRILDARFLEKEHEAGAYLFSLHDANGEHVIDTDWYVFQREDSSKNEVLEVMVEFPQNSPFIGKAKLWFSETGSISSEGEELNNEINKCIWNLEEGMEEIYIKITPEKVDGEEGIGSYKISVSL